MLATVITVKNPFNPTQHREVAQYHRPRRLDKLAPKTMLPYICVLNGVPLLKDEYKVKLKHRDIAVFVTMPQGGGDSNPLKIVLMVALAVVAPQIGFGIASSFGTSIGAFASTSALGSFIGGAIGFLGNQLISAAFSSSNQTSSQRQQALVSPSPTYNLSAQGNRARPGEPIPDFYGYHKHFPDFAADPYTEYAGNNQYLYQLFCLGQGEYDIDTIYIGDTPVSSFPEITCEIYGPDQRVTLFPSIVNTSGEVAGQEATYNVALGPFVVCPPGVRVTAVAFDIVATRGLFYANNSGGLDALTTTFRLEVRAIDDDGAALGGWSTVGNGSMSAADATPIRRSYRYSVSEARYEARVTRTDVKNTSSRAGHEIVWASLRGYTAGANYYGDVTMLAMRAKATNNLTTQSSRQVNVTKTRKLEVWNGSSWSARIATRNPAWAMCNMLKAEYGGNLPDSRLALDSFLERAETWDARGDQFNGGFDNAGTLFEAVNTVAAAGRAKVYEQGGIWYCWRHEAQAMPVALFNMRNIARNSAHAEFALPTEVGADAVDVSYLDENTWTEKTVRCQLPDGTANNPAQIKLFGVTSAAQAWREGMYKAACNRYQRLPFTFSTEMEGFIPTFGDLISLAHDRANWGSSGDVLSYDSGTQTITTSEPLDFSGSGPWYFGFRLRDLSFDGPYEATAGVDDYHAVLTTPLDFVPDTGSDRERTSYRFGAGQQFGRQALVMKVQPRSLSSVEIATINEDDAIHTADTSTAPPTSTQWNLPAVITRPSVGELQVTLGGSANNPLLLISWQASAGADRYYVELSYDGGVTWTRMAEPSTSDAAVPARRGYVNVRVAATGLAQGDYAYWAGNPYSVAPPDVPVFLVSVQPDGTREFSWSMAETPPDLLGFEIRYRLGSGWTWDDLSALHNGLLTASPFESNQLSAGDYTFAIKAVDDSYVRSENATFISGTLSDPRLAGVLFNELPHTQNWPGTKTNCNAQDNKLVSNDQETWADKTSWDAWTQWVTVPYATISYEHTAIDIGAILAFTPFVDVVANGTLTIEESHSDDGSGYSSWAAIGDLVTARYIKIRVALTGVSGVPVITSMNIKLSAVSQDEDLNDIVTSSLSGSYRIGVGDIRLPIAKSYTIITQATVTLQNVGGGWSWELIDKDTSVGPRIKIYNASNTLADCTIDAYVRGAK